jgi:hypothetical protein
MGTLLSPWGKVVAMIVSFVSSFLRDGCKDLADGIGIRTSEASRVCAEVEG